MVEEVAGMTEQEKVGIIDLDDVNVRKGDGLFTAFVLSLAKLESKLVIVKLFLSISERDLYILFLLE